MGLIQMGKVGSMAVLLAMLTCAPAAFADAQTVRFLEGAEAAASLTQQELSEAIMPFLANDAIDVRNTLALPPVPDTAADKADVALMREMIASASRERWQTALEDDASVYPRFNKQMGVEISRKKFPRLIALLNRVSADALALSSRAKAVFQRARPFQRYALKRVCGFAVPPKPEANPTKGSSYPSGHSTVSWAAALIMMEVSPESAQAIIGRAASYGNSRVICGLHFPADISAGQGLAAHLMDKLFALPEFRRDLQCAKNEFSYVRQGMRSEDLPACQ